MDKILLIDVRTPSHVKTITQVFFKGDLDVYKSIVVIAPDTLAVPKWRVELIKYSFLPSSYASLLKILSLAKRLEKYSEKPVRFVYFGAVNFGPLYDVLNARLDFQEQLLVEDGISSYLNLKVSSRWIKAILITVIAGRRASIASAKFFSGSNDLKTVVYTDKPQLLDLMGIKTEVRALQSGWGKSVGKTSAIYLLSSSSVEYGLCSIERYKELMRRISRCYVGQQVVVSFHHNEAQADTKLDILKSFFEVERVVERSSAVEADMNETGKMIEVIAPFNSVALNLVDSGRAGKMSLYDDNGPNIRLRKKLFRELDRRLKLEIDIYE